jgi:hypothetical protein
MNLLVLLAIVLLIIAGHQLLRIVELSRGLKKTKEWQISDKDNNMMGKALLGFMFLFFLFLEPKSIAVGVCAECGWLGPA